MARVLLRMGLYTDVDRAALALYADGWGLWVEAVGHLREEGEVLVTESGYHYANPWRGVANRAQDTMRRMFAEFGLTPSARARLSVPQTPEEPSLAEQLFAMVNEGSEADGE